MRKAIFVILLSIPLLFSCGSGDKESQQTLEQCEDNDNDGLCNDSDNCPNTFNPEQLDTNYNGVGDICEIQCEDSDSDGVCDEQDNCLLTPNPNQWDSDGNNIGDACEENCIDSDFDLICDGGDNCPTVANFMQFDSDLDGEGDSCDEDDDNDGIIDDEDNCPLTYNPEQELVCAGDFDSDGMADDVDNCPYVYNPAQEDSDGNGVGDFCEPEDSDGDGITDDIDNCPFIANEDQADSDFDGIGDACEGSSCEEFLTYYLDADGDGFGTPDTTIEACQLPDGYVTNNADCDDTNADVWQMLDYLYVDSDLDGYTIDESGAVCSGEVLPAGYANETLGLDCNDTKSEINPGAFDVADAKDNDCDNIIDEGSAVLFMTMDDQLNFLKDSSDSNLTIAQGDQTNPIAQTSPGYESDYAAQFAGTSGGYLTKNFGLFEPKPFPEGNIDKSISTWIYISTNSTCLNSAYCVIGGIGIPSGSLNPLVKEGSNFQISVDNNGKIAILGWLPWNDWNTSVAIDNYLDDWHHIAVTYDALSTKTILYIDGVAVDSTTSYKFSTHYGLYLLRIVIGEEIDKSGMRFDGLIDDFAIYNKALSADEVCKIANCSNL